MNVRGERILIFGDSLSHFGADSAPEIWDVDRGSARVGTPGDLLASMLLEQGAQAVRVNARVSRSAHNFFTRENHQALFASDQAFAPTKVIIILGTNDIGLNMDADANAMRRIRDFYKGLGAEVWAIGPFQYLNDRYTQGAPAVIEMMQGVFRPRYLDPRPITAMVGRSRDGVHFGAEAARQTALGLQQLVLSSSSGKGTLMMLGVGLLAAIGGSIAYSWWKTGKASPLLSGLGERCSVDLPPAAFKRCVARQKRAQLGASEDPLAERQRISREINELIRDPDPNAMDVAQDLALQHEIKLSELAKGGTDDRGTFWIDSKDKDVLEQDRVSWRIKRVNERHGGECKVSFDVRVDGKRVGGEEREHDHVKFEEHYQGSRDYCRRAATAQAWAIAKEVKKIRRNHSLSVHTHDIWQALDKDNSNPEELFGLGGAREDRNEHPTETFKMLMQTAESPAELVAARDYALEHGIKIGALRTLYLSPVGAADDPATRVSWKITRTHKSEGPWDNEGNDLYDVEWDTLLDNEPLHIGAGYARRAKSLRELEQQVGAEAWGIANELKALRGKPFTQKKYRMRVVDAIYSDAARDHLKEQPELFGLDGKRLDSDRWWERRKFRKLTEDEGGSEVALDYVEEHEDTISSLTTYTDDDNAGSIRVFDSDSGKPAARWKVHKTTRNDGSVYWEPETILGTWGDEFYPPKVAFQPEVFDTAEEARRVAAMNAWAAANILRRLGRNAPRDEQEAALKREMPDEVEQLEKKRHLFGLGARQSIKRGSDIGPDKMNQDWSYVVGDEDFKDKRREFRLLIKDDGPEVLDVAEDFAERHEIPISQLTTLNHDHADAGIVMIHPAKGSYDSYQVWWDVYEDPKNPGQWQPELLLAWGAAREPIGSVPHIRNGEWTKPVIPFGTAESAEEARKIAAMNAWNVSKILRELPRDASLEDARKLLQEFEQTSTPSKRFASAFRTFNKRELFGQSSALQSRGMGTTDGYRVAYSLVTRRDGKIVTVRKVVEAPRALTLPEAEAWRRKWAKAGNTAWVETMAGQHVPVKGAKRPAGFVDDAQPGDVHATLTADYARPR